MPKSAAHKKGQRLRGWKDIQSKKRTTKKTKLALFALGGIVILLLVAQLVKVITASFTPWKETNIKRTYLWDGKFNLNLVIKAKNVALVSFNPTDKKVTFINVPDPTYLEVPFGFGMWQVSSIYDLGDSQKDFGGGRLLKQTMADLFGLPVDGYIQFLDKYAQKDIAEVVEEIRKSPFSVVGMLGFIKTDMTPFELFRINMGLSSVRFDKVREINLEEVEDLLLNEKLPDGTLVYKPDTIKLDALISNLTDNIIKQEHKTIAIFNSTKYPGLAQKAARLISNIGGDVIITANGQEAIKKTQIIGPQSKTLERLRQIFNSSDIIDPKEKDLSSSRADINLFLGEDYIE